MKRGLAMSSRGAKSQKVATVSLFSGAGGLDLGFEATGFFETVIALDSDPDCVRTMEMNRGLQFQNAEGFLQNATISGITVEEWLSDASPPKRPWVLIGGPPCQPFSAMGRKENLKDSRSSGVFDFLQAVERLRPTAFVLENVPRLAVNQGGRIRKRIESAVRQSGYSYSECVLNAADFGAFTRRKRFFVFGAADENGRIDPPLPSFMQPTLDQPLLSGLLPPWRGCREALADLENAPSGCLPDHAVLSHTAEVTRRFRSLKPGQYDHVRKRAKLHPDRPCPSMIAGGKSGFAHHIHYVSRELTSRECARLQGFPDKFRFAGSPLMVAKQIVNAVPVPLATAVASAVAEYLHRVRKGADMKRTIREVRQR